jgi:hypothetical protein
LDDESARSGAQRGDHVLVGVVRGQHEHPDPGEIFVRGDHPGGLDAVQVGHADIHHQPVVLPGE